MMPLVRMGDPLKPFGGEVLDGHYEAFGKPVACVGDRARCDKHGMTHITEGTAGSTIDGKPVALDGHRCACGCQLVSTLAATSMSVAP
ncbi:PAAR motif protein [compost metagenome]